MRRNMTALALTAMLASCAMLGGGSDLKKFMEAEAAYTFAVNRLADLREKGKIDDDTFRLLDPLVQEGNNILKLMENQLRVDPGAKLKVEYIDRLLGLVENLTLAYYKNKEK